MSTTEGGGAGDRDGGRERATDPARLVRLAVRFYFGVLFAAVAWRWGWAGEPLFYASSADAARGLRLLHDLVLGVGCALCVIALSRELTRRTRWGEALARALAAAVGPLNGRQVLLLALVSGVAEEAFFRGALQPRVGYVAASLIFGLVHFVPERAFLPWTAFSIAAGFLLGALFDFTGNLAAPITTHVLVNAVNLRLLTRDYAPSPPRPETPPPA